MTCQSPEDARLPPPLMTSEPGSFARQTIVERKPEIIQRVSADHDYPPEITAALETFSDEIAHRQVQPVSETVGDAAFWNSQWACYADCTWLELPWFFAETYFYRRLLEATRYFHPGPQFHADPFAPQKREQEAGAVAQVATVWPQIAETDPERRFTLLLHACLWGNRADLSNLTVREQAVGDTTADRAHILKDDTAEVAALLQAGVGQVAFINDNVGADSLFDLILGDFLIAQGWARQIVFHLKAQPFFVSDAMPQDIRHMIVRLRGAADAGLAALGTRLNAALETGRLVLTTHPFWTRSLHFHEMPESVRAQLEQADLIILKGDVNYRRLLADRHWPPTTALAEVTQDFPRPYLVLRTLKGEIIVDLAPGQAERLDAEDPTWQINGKRGLIQLVTAPPQKG